jgi:hypothetical protein
MPVQAFDKKYDQNMIPTPKWGNTTILNSIHDPCQQQRQHQRPGV